jgi:hypothetical protein
MGRFRSNCHGERRLPSDDCADRGCPHQTCEQVSEKQRRDALERNAARQKHTFDQSGDPERDEDEPSDGLLVGFLAAGLAQSKNRSGLGWWFASLFFGPVCTLLIVLLDPIRPTPTG